MILPPFDDPAVAKPSNIEVFDKKRRKVPVDLDKPFFKITRPEYPACSHHDRGVTLEMGSREVFCLCGVKIDAFDALLIYAHAQRRLINHANVIQEHERKEAEKKAKRPFVKDVRGFARQQSTRGRFLGYRVSLDCGHTLFWGRREPPRRATCDQCFRNEQLTAQGVAIAKP